MEDVFDFGNLTAQEVEEAPGASGGKRRKYEVNPFTKWIKECIDRGKGKEVVLPPKAVKDALQLIRNAAEDLKYGVHIRLYNKGSRINQNEIDSLAPQAKVTVKFWPAPKRKYTPRQSVESATDTQDPVSE